MISSTFSNVWTRRFTNDFLWERRSRVLLIKWSIESQFFKLNEQSSQFKLTEHVKTSIEDETRITARFKKLKIWARDTNNWWLTKLSRILTRLEKCMLESWIWFWTFCNWNETVKSHDFLSISWWRFLETRIFW